MRGHTHRVINADTLPLPRRPCIRRRGETRAEGDGISTPSLPYTTAHALHKTDKGIISVLEGLDIVESFIARVS